MQVWDAASIPVGRHRYFVGQLDGALRFGDGVRNWQDRYPANRWRR